MREKFYPLDELQKWYARNCNGDWEHQNGVRIFTIDNPGWGIEVDTIETDVPLDNVAYRLVERSASDWYAFSVQRGIFSGACGPDNLNQLVTEFLNLLNALHAR